MGSRNRQFSVPHSMDTVFFFLAKHCPTISSCERESCLSRDTDAASRNCFQTVVRRTTYTYINGLQPGPCTLYHRSVGRTASLRRQKVASWNRNSNYRRRRNKQWYFRVDLENWQWSSKVNSQNHVWPTAEWRQQQIWHFDFFFRNLHENDPSRRKCFDAALTLSCVHLFNPTRHFV